MTEHPDVVIIERLLGEPSKLATLLALPSPLQSALWICACVALDDAPLWVIAGTDNGAAWCRVPDEAEPTKMLQARKWCGGHAEPESVLMWLRGEVATPWAGNGDGSGSLKVLETFRRKIVARSS